MRHHFTHASGERLLYGVLSAVIARSRATRQCQCLIVHPELVERAGLEPFRLVILSSVNCYTMTICCIRLIPLGISSFRYLVRIADNDEQD